ncbi:MAG: ABC transporter permease [Bdellovibrionales bacterium]
MSYWIKPKSFFFSKKQQILLLLFTVLIWCALVSPIGYLFEAFIDGFSNNFLESIRIEFWGMLKTTLLLSAMVLVGSTLIAAAQNLIYFNLEMKWKKIAHVIFLLPLALPAYVLAFIFVGAIGTGSPLETFLFNSYHSIHKILPLQDSIFLAALSLSIVLSPYMYMNLRLGFAGIPDSILESASLLSTKSFVHINKIYIPLLFPWWKQASILILLECFADFGAVSIFHVETFSTGIYKHWFALFSLESARELSSLVILGVFGLILALRMAQFKKWQISGRVRLQRKIKLSKTIKLILYPIVFLASFFGVAFPFSQLLVWAMDVSGGILFGFEYISNTLSLSFLALIFSSIVALAFLYLCRFNRSKLVGLLNESVQLGYGIPGTILAVAIYYPFSHLDRWIANLINLDSGWLSGGVFITVIGLSFRFFKVMYQPLYGYFTSLNYNIEENASLLDPSRWNIVRKIHLPLLWPVYLSSSILFLVDCFKEMPIQLMTRSFGWDTLSIKIYEYTSEGEWERAAALSLVLVALGLVPIFLLARREHESPA